MTAPEPDDALALDVVAARWERLRARLLAAGGDGVRVVAVTKGFDERAVVAARALGLLDLGENYAQELRAKAAALGAPPDLRWHFIGRLQRNKVRSLADLVTCWQSVDRLAVGREIARWAPGASVLVQVNCSEEPQKGGCAWGDVRPLVADLGREGLRVEGLMGVGPAGPPEAAAEPFRRLVALADDLGLPVRSIGMSRDLEVAVAAGSTMVRIGEDLFGRRPARTPAGAPITGDGGDPG